MEPILTQDVIINWAQNQDTVLPQLKINISDLAYELLNKENMWRILGTRSRVQMIPILTILYVLWSLLSFPYNRITLQSCLKGENNSTHVRPAQETQAILGPVFGDDYIRQWQNGTKAHDAEVISAYEVTSYIREIMGKGNGTMWRIQCPDSIATRYGSLQATTQNDKHIKYIFTVDLYQAIAVLPSLLGSIVQTIRFLGPKQCAVSFVEGRSTDGTYQILAALQDELERLGAVFYMTTSDVSPHDGKQDRFGGLALLRNLALAPLVMDKASFSPDAQVVFLNDIYLCPHDILELLYQQKIQHATMTCGMDWSHSGAIFYDIYVARSIVGETFWQIAQDGGWHFSGNLFWADRATHAKYHNHQPFQVYACWNGGAVISAKPILERRIKFRRNGEGECYMGEPTLFAKDLWRLGLGRIQVVPSVNVGYDNGTEEAKDLHGRVEDHLNMTSGDLQTELVEWQDSPPSLVKCMEQFHEPYWVPST